MKRLAIFCDGTWNRLDAQHLTNVVKAARTVLPEAPDGTLQITYYNEGVGTSYLVSQRLESSIAGGFGLGLTDKIAEAYRFLVLNYEPGDQIYIFGFSRGAYTARSLAGLIRNCGIPSRDHIEKVPAALAFYLDRSAYKDPNSDAARRFRAAHSPRILINEADREWRRSNGFTDNLDAIPFFRLTYIGVWDTVGALGIPKHLLIERLMRTSRKYQFHDGDLSSSIGAARHAIALDEDRRSFEPSLWHNLDDLNSRPDRAAAYHQEWFPGDHGSVGGGGDIAGHSTAALLWVLEGAAECGLALDGKQLERYRADLDHLAPLRNRSAPPGWMERLYRRKPRKGPRSWDHLSEAARQRLLHEPEGKGEYWPESLRNLFEEIRIRRAGLARQLKEGSSDA